LVIRRYKLAKEDLINIGTVNIGEIARFIKKPSSSVLARLVIYNRHKATGMREFDLATIKSRKITVEELRDAVRQTGWEGNLAGLSWSRYFFYKGETDEWHEAKELSRVQRQIDSYEVGEYAYLADI